MTTQQSKNLTIVCIVGAFALLLILFLLRSSGPQLPELPDPNGYDDFVAAAKLVVEGSADYRDLNIDELRELVASNAPAVNRAYIGLSRDCRVPLKEDWNYINFTLLSELIHPKQLIYAFMAEGHLAELEKRHGDAIVSYLDAARVGRKATRGGLLLHGMVGIACEAVALDPIPNLIPNLSADQCRTAIQTLVDMDSASEPAESILEQESFYQKRVASFREKLSGWANFKSGKRIRSNFIQKHHAQQRMRRELLITLAARAYELEKGAPPPNASNLVPDYLKEPPKDPATGDPLQLTPQ